jgi:hypothetical protein
VKRPASAPSCERMTLSIIPTRRMLAASTDCGAFISGSIARRSDATSIPQSDGRHTLASSARRVSQRACVGTVPYRRVAWRGLMITLIRAEDGTLWLSLRLFYRNVARCSG